MNRNIRATSAVLIVIAGLALVLFSFANPYSATAFEGSKWIALNSGPVDQPANLVALGSDDSRMVGRFSMPGFSLGEVQLKGESWQQVTFPGQGRTSRVGAPDLPVLRKMFAIPPETDLVVRVDAVDVERFQDIWIQPAQRLLKENESAQAHATDYDADLYGQDAFYPQTWVQAGVAGVIHGVRLGQLQVRPFRYNPVTGELLVARQIDFRVEFKGENPQSALDYTTRTVPEHLVPTYRSLLLNYKFMDYGKAKNDGGVDYLIIVDDALENAASLADLVAYHTGLGRSVQVLNTTTTSMTPDAIKTFIQAEYDSNTPPDLDYVLLVGDVSVIPFKDNAFDYNDSDAWYGWLEGDDIFGDVGLGRFPATSEAELDIMVSKTLNFHNEVESGSWLSKSVLVAHKQNYPEKYTECKDSIFNHTFTFDPPIMDRIYGGDPATHGSNDQVVAAIEEGRGVVNYRGHGDETSWTEWSWDGEYFTTAIVRALANGQKTPIVFSIACLNLNMMSSSSETLGEAFIRYDQGAVAFLGAIHPSYTLPNHDFDRALYYGPWDNDVTPIGDLLVWANIDMYNVYCEPGEECWGEDNITMYLWVGDPTIEIPVAGLKSPGDLAAQAMSTSEIKLTWTDRSDDEEGYSIERMDGDSAFVEVDTVSADIVTWTDTGLEECGHYSYRLRAYNGLDFSLYSDEVHTQTLGSKPSDLAGIGTAIDEITLTWTDNTTTEAGFSIFRKDPVKADFEKIFQADMNATQYVDSGLAEGTVYEYKVATTTLGGDSEPIGPVDPITLPHAPVNLVAEPDNDISVALTWTDMSQGEQGYYVYRSPVATASHVQVGSVDADAVAFVDSTAQEATEYRYNVRGFNASGEGPACVSVQTLTVPATPTDLTAKPVSTSQINLVWTDNSSGEQGIRVERDLGAGFETAANVHADGVLYGDTGYTEGTLVSYRVFAFNATGDSLASLTVQTMTKPISPIDLTAQRIEGGSVALAWTDRSATEQGYRIERKIDDEDFAPIGTVSADETRFEDASAPTQGAVYQVCAYNDYTDSDFSDPAQVEPSGEADDDDDDEADDDDSGSDDDDDNDDEGCGC